MTFGPITVGDILDLMDDCIERAEERTEEFDGVQKQVVVELANRLNSLANYLRSSPPSEMARQFPHVPDEVLADSAGAHEGAPFPMAFFSGGPPIPGSMPGRVMPGEVEEAGADEEES